MEGYTKIGRIRPNYTGAWNAGTAYTVLEMVKNEAGTASYIAKQDVPAGTPLTDEACWAMVLDAGDVIDAAEKAAERANKAADALGIVQTATGSVIAVGDASDMPFKGLKLFGKTTQDGTPTPEMPVDLVNVGEGGSVGVNVCGKNLLNPHKFVVTNGYTNIVRGDVWIENSALNNYDYGHTAVRLCAGKTYTAYYEVDIQSLTGNGTQASSMQIGFEGNLWAPAVSNTGIVRYTRTYTPAADREVKVCFYMNYGNDGDTKRRISGRFRIMVIEGNYTLDTMPPFEPYKNGGSLTAFTPNGLAGIPVSSGGNYTDSNGQQWVCDEIDLERGVYIQRISDKIFTGTESFNIYGDIITHYLPHAANDTGLCTRGKVYYPNNTNIGFSATKFGVSTINDFKLVLSEWYNAGKPMIVRYIRNTPIETPLTAEEIAAYRALRTNYPHTTVFNDAGADMEVKYVADTKLYIDNKFAALQEALINA